MRVARSVVAAVLVSCGALSLRAQQPQRPACEGAEHHQFDFWIGTWTVRDSSGHVVGSSTIEPISAGCGIAEHWRAASGPSGESLNAFTATDKQWHQWWVGGGGGVFSLAGSFADGSMTLSGDQQLPSGQSVRNRITWTPLRDGRVRQHWMQSRDGGATWIEAFDGYYERRTE